MMLLMHKLEHGSLKKFMERPDVQEIVNQPGYFRAPKGTSTPQKREKTLKQWWSHGAMPVIKGVAPVLYKLLREHPSALRTQYYPLSQSVQNEEIGE